MTSRVFRAPKVPEVFLLFWVVKLLTTGIGESGAGFLGTPSIPLAALVGIGGFFLALWLQLRATRYHPVRYWLTAPLPGANGSTGAQCYSPSASARCWVTPPRSTSAPGSLGRSCSSA